MVCPILISVSVTPGALAALAAHVPDAIYAAAPALDCRSERRDNITLTLPRPCLARCNGRAALRIPSRLTQFGPDRKSPTDSATGSRVPVDGRCAGGEIAPPLHFVRVYRNLRPPCGRRR